VKGTIEERMRVVLKAHQGHTKVEEDPVTLRDLYNMFAAQDEPSHLPKMFLNLWYTSFLTA
jgi:hypothetical protein